MLSAVERVQTQRAIQRGRCPECGSDERVTDRNSGEIICRNCGLVISELMLNQNPEWRAFTPEERRAKVRVGSPTSLRNFDKGLSTTFQPYRDARGKALPLTKRLKMMRLRKWQVRARVHSSTQRNLSQAMNVVTRLSDTLRIPQDVAETGALIYRKALDAGLVRGRSIKSLAAAALYAACRITQTPRSLKAVVNVSTRDRKEISRCYRLLQRELDIKMPIDEPYKYIAKIASRAGLDQTIQNRARELLHKAKTVNAVVGKGPVGLAAAALYIATRLAKKSVTQRALAKAAGVTEVTVRNRYKALDRSLGLGLRKDDDESER